MTCQHCWEITRREVESWQCDMHADQFSCPDALIDFIAKFRECGIIIYDGGNSHVVIGYCPGAARSARLPA